MHNCVHISTQNEPTGHLFDVAGPAQSVNLIHAAIRSNQLSLALALIAELKVDLKLLKQVN